MKVDELEIAMELLTGKGLNRASFARAVLGKKDVNPKDKDVTRDAFNSVLELVREEHGDNIYKDGHEFFFKEEDLETFRKQIAELKDQNAALRKTIVKLSGNPKSAVERKQWLYKKGKGTMFNISEVTEKLNEGWKDHPEG